MYCSVKKIVIIILIILIIALVSLDHFYSYLFGNIPLLDGDYADFKEVEDSYNVIMAILCVCCAGLAAGLTMGLLSLDITKLEIKLMTGNKEDKEAVRNVLPIVKQHHLLLVTLLLFNSLANEALPIFLGALVPNYLALILSVTLVLLFGEILPSACFTGKGQLLLASKFIPVVELLITLLKPIAYPLSKALDYIFGDEETSSTISREDLEALVLLQSPIDINKKPYNSNSNNNNHNDNGNLSNYEIKMMTEILRLSKTFVYDAMVTMEKVFMLSDNIILDRDTLQSILVAGYSCIPIYKGNNKENILGLLIVKSLIVINPSDRVKISTLSLVKPLYVKLNTPLLQMLNIFRDSKCGKMALVSEDFISSIINTENDDFNSVNISILGMITLEDVIERMIQDDIMDEADVIISSSESNKTISTFTSYQIGNSPVKQSMNATNESQQRRKISKRNTSVDNLNHISDKTSNNNWYSSISNLLSQLKFNNDKMQYNEIKNFSIDNEI
jgi:metal transporter CNNM